MAKKNKTFRGDRSKRTYNPCNCYYCNGTSKDEKVKLKTKHLDKEIKDETHNN